MYYISWVVKNLHYILGGVVVVLVIVLAVSTSSNTRLVKELQYQKEISIKKSEKKVDSLKKIIKLDSIILTRRLDSVNKRIESLKKNYEISQKELVKLQQDISKYLVSSDSIRFALFTELITEMD